MSPNRLHNYSVDNFLTDVGRTLYGAISDKGLIAIGLAGSGFVRVLVQDVDITRDLAMITFIAFSLMTTLGLWKHIKNGNPDAKEFLIKTGTQLSVMVSVIVMGYLFGIAIFSVRQIAARIGVIDIPKGPNVAMYFVYSGYMITFTYHALKSLDLIDQIMPDYVPPWFSATFRRFRKSGDFADLLKTPPQSKENNSEEKTDP